jgi:shikimate kinase
MGKSSDNLEKPGRVITAPHDSLMSALRRLDQRLRKTVEEARTAFGPGAAADPYRGLYVQPADAERLLAREPLVSPFHASVPESDGPAFGPHEEGSRLAVLGRAFNLAHFDLDIVVIALAPEVDLRYERLYAYLQDDVARTRPTVDLALNLLCASPAGHLVRRAHFAADAALVRQGILILGNDGRPATSLLGQTLRLDDVVVRLLLEQKGLDARVTRYCRLVRPKQSMPESSLLSEVRRSLADLIAQTRRSRQPLCLYFQGPRNAGKAAAAEILATEANAALLTFDIGRALVMEPDFAAVFRVALREAWWRGVVLYLEPWEAVTTPDRVTALQELAAALAEHNGVTILAGEAPWVAFPGGPAGVLSVPFTMPAFTQRRVSWQSRLAAAGTELPPADLDSLADRFRLTADQIHEAVAASVSQARWRSAAAAGQAEVGGPTLADLFAAARAQSGHQLAQLARRVEPRHTWTDLVLPDDAVTQLRDMCQQVKQRRHVLDDWGFGKKLSLGRGVNALFVGPPGTGKTTAAEIIALELGLELYEIDLSRLLSKWVGELQKNLDALFTAAENGNAILCFHEADALFSKRTESRDAHDLFVNQEIAYLLQKIEQYEGVAILTTNLRQNMDEAFTRRLQFIVEFPFPGALQREQIWQVLMPPSAPRAETIDFAWLGRSLPVAGGNIQGIVLGAAYLAAGNGGRIDMKHLLRAARREYGKMGKVWDLTRTPE